jgi:hypothetical protein
LEVKDMASRRDNWNGMNWILKSSRLAIYLRDGMACFYCGSDFMNEDTKLSLDHVTPHCEGGGNKPNNLITCCKRCNEKRGAKEIGQWLMQIALENNINPAVISSSLNEQLNQDIRPFREIAKSILEARPKWHNALRYATKMVEELV